jgi:hypothetical protein
MCGLSLRILFVTVLKGKLSLATPLSRLIDLYICPWLRRKCPKEAITRLSLYVVEYP